MVHERATALVNDFERKCEVTLAPAIAGHLQWEITRAIEAETQELRQVLQQIIDGAVHPETAVRRVMVDLAPIRKVLAKFTNK
jgi:hypothetical protein